MDELQGSDRISKTAPTLLNRQFCYSRNRLSVHCGGAVNSFGGTAMAEALLEKEIVEKARHSETIEALEEKVKDGVKFAKKFGKSSAEAAEELLEETTKQIKRHPAGYVVGALGVGMLLGGLMGLFIRRRK
jgi:hypothetical protein